MLPTINCGIVATFASGTKPANKHDICAQHPDLFLKLKGTKTYQFIGLTGSPTSTSPNSNTRLIRILLVTAMHRILVREDTVEFRLKNLVNANLSPISIRQFFQMTTISEKPLLTLSTPYSQLIFMGWKLGPLSMEIHFLGSVTRAILVQASYLMTMTTMKTLRK